MSCSSYCRFKFVKLSAAVSFLLASNLYAATIGSPHIQTTQNQPLVATIEVSDIDADNFSIALANRQIYEQMGLNPKPTMSVSFAKTSANSGKIIINTRSPVTEPFADVVLTINNAGTQSVIPKTLLLPLGGATQPKTMTTQANSQTTGNTKQPDLPVVSQTPNNTTIGRPIIGQPLPINNSLPPPLHTSQTNVASEEEAQTANGNQALTVNISRTYRSLQSGGTSQNATQKYSGSNNYGMPLQNNTTTESNTKTQDTAAHTVPEEQPESGQAQAQAQAQVKQKRTDEQATPTPSIALGTQTYTVQRNDNLWTIANQIANENNLSIQTVMQQIKAYNQDAFINGDMSLLKANAELKLPDYDVIPSKLGIRAAIDARNTQKNKNNQQATTSSTQNLQNKRTADQNTQASTNSNKTITQALPRPHVTLVTPSTSGNATGGQTSASATGTGLNSGLLSELKSARQLTAQKAQKVQELSKQLQESTNRMHIQNQRLADLEQRLKDLRNK